MLVGTSADEMLASAEGNVKVCAGGKGGG